MIDMYQDYFSLCDLLTILKGKLVKVPMSQDGEKIIGISPIEFNKLSSVDQLDFLQWITLECPLYSVWLKVEEKEVIVI